METDPHRPPENERWLGGRDEPGNIHVRTRFLYSEARPPEIIVPAGRVTHAFSRGALVIASDWGGDTQDVVSEVQRAIASFGDDANLTITISRTAPEA